ncbi:TerC family protein [Cohnella nanjingensis]|uniref:TerC family protein n=1 Tax=Cohnella nanjingensis TaxID=1387779 RepID=A0A7X0VGY8_9BACL|nr:TerC family protein [Cohnella nanjingensis]MBB6673361.1 TerC family protein [Cohnella nanjingensis]
MDGEWVLTLLDIILINIILSGDNAVVIALASRNLAPDHQKKAIFWGTFGAVALRVVLTFVAVRLLEIPLVQAAGGLLLLYIAWKLLHDDHAGENIRGGTTLAGAIRTIVVADVVMSLDNVVAVAGAARGNLAMIIVGLAISVPLIIWCSRFLTKLMTRFPILVWIGAGLLGYSAGEMLVGDPYAGELLEGMLSDFTEALPFLMGVFFVAYGAAAAYHERRSTRRKHKYSR